MTEEEFIDYFHNQFKDVAGKLTLDQISILQFYLRDVHECDEFANELLAYNSIEMKNILELIRNGIRELDEKYTLVLKIPLKIDKDHVWTVMNRYNENDAGDEEHDYLPLLISKTDIMKNITSTGSYIALEKDLRNLMSQANVMIKDIEEKYDVVFDEIENLHDKFGKWNL